MAVFLGLGENDTDALRSLDKFDDHRRATDHSNQIIGLAGLVSKGGDRQSDALAGHELKTPLFVPRTRDGLGFIQRIDAKDLELS